MKLELNTWSVQGALLTLKTLQQNYTVFMFQCKITKWREIP